MKAKCVKGSEYGELVQGEVYSVREHDWLHYEILLPSGSWSVGWFKTRFELVDDQPEPKGTEWLVHYPVDDTTYTYGTRKEAEEQAAREAGTAYPARVYKLVSEAKVTMEDVG